MPRFAANLSVLFTEVDFLARFALAREAGFEAVECQFPYAFSAAAVDAALTANHLELVLLNAPPGDFAKGERGIAALPGRAADFTQSIATAIEYARAVRCPRVHVMSGLVQHGANTRTLIANMRNAAHAAATHGIDLLLEPINLRDMPGYLLHRTADAVSVINEIGCDNVKLQFDLYHRQIMEGDLSAAIRDYAARTGHIQIAQPPDRGEPDRGEIDFEYVLQALDDSGYAGWIGCEYKPRAGTLAGLGWFDVWRVSSSGERQ